MSPSDRKAISEAAVALCAVQPPGPGAPGTPQRTVRDRLRSLIWEQVHEHVSEWVLDRIEVAIRASYEGGAASEARHRKVVTRRVEIDEDEGT